MKHILIVDDEKLIRDTLAEILRLHGYGTVTAIGAMTAKSRMNDYIINLVITDCGLQGKVSGVDLTGWVVLHAPHIPVIGMSGDGRNMQKFMAAGACAFFTKPVDTTALLFAITANLGEAEEAKDGDS